MKDQRSQGASDNGVLDIKVKLESATNKGISSAHDGDDSKVEKGARRHHRRNIMILAGLLGVMITGSYLMKNLFVAKASHNAYPPTKVAVFAAKEYQLPNLFEGVGELEAIHEVWIAAEVMGRVMSIHFESGQFVEKGQLLFQLADAREKSERERLEAERDFLALQLKRYERLAKERAVDVSKYDEARSQLMQIDASLNAIEVAIAEKSIRAPFAGTVGISHIHLGDIINAGQKLTTLVDESRFRANFTLDEKQMKTLSIGQSVDVFISALGSRFPATISAIDPLISNARLISVQADIEATRTQLLGLKSGMFVKALVKGESINTLLIPETALTYTIYGSSVWVVNRLEEAAREVKAVRVEVGIRRDGFVEITKGLMSGEEVIVSGQHKLGDDSVIEVIESESLPLILPESISESASALITL